MCCSHVRMIKHVPYGPYVLSMGQTHGVPWAIVLSEMSRWVNERNEFESAKSQNQKLPETDLVIFHYLMRSNVISQQWNDGLYFIRSIPKKW